MWAFAIMIPRERCHLYIDIFNKYVGMYIHKISVQNVDTHIYVYRCN